MKYLLLSVLFLSLFMIGQVPPADAQLAVQPKTLVKGSSDAVYWIRANGDRALIPNMKVFYSWFTPFDLNRIQHLSDEQLSSIRLTGTIFYRPGSRLLKIAADPKVYAVGADSTLHWIETEDLARQFYGPRWQNFIDDVPDYLFVNYTIGRSYNSFSNWETAVVPSTP